MAMSDDVKHSLIWATAITVAIVSVVALIVAYNLYSWRVIAEGGYEEASLMGQSGTHWVKKTPEPSVEVKQ